MSQTESPSPGFGPDTAAEGYRAVRATSVALCEPLAVEDYIIQAMADTSPPKWHLAHTTWFFEQFILVPYAPHYRVFHPGYGHLFNSYYETVGSFFPRTRRGHLARPTVDEVYRYRAHVDAAMTELLAAPPAAHRADLLFRVELGLHHEQQHQELLLTDIQYNFAINPLRPVYRPAPHRAQPPAPPLTWLDYPGGVKEIGHQGSGFAYDNETPRHAVYLDAYRLASRPSTNGEFLEFIAAEGYQRPELWLSDGWRTVQQQGWTAPLYWEFNAGEWWRMGLSGFEPLELDAPVCHVSFYEADAYARWRGARLPREAEWECAAATQPIQGNFQESGLFRPTVAAAGTGLAQMFGDVWEWTQSPYAPYPKFRPLAGSLGEYNGKFMCNQLVLRGGSCATPAAHIRASYRNFFYPPDRWQFTGIRLAGDAL